MTSKTQPVRGFVCDVLDVVPAPAQVVTDKIQDAEAAMRAEHAAMFSKAPNVVRDGLSLSIFPTVRTR